MAGLLDFNDPNALNTLGLIGGLLSARKGDNWPLMLQQAAMRQEAIRRGQIDEEMRREQMAQAKKMQEQQAQRQAAIASLAQQRPDLAPLLQIDPSMGVQRAFPDPTKNAYTLGPGQQRFEGGKPVASVPQERKAPEGMQYNDQGQLVEIPGYVSMRSKIAAAGRAPSDTGKPPQGYRWRQDGSLEPIPGGPADAKVGKEADKERLQAQGALQKAGLVMQKVDEALGQIKGGMLPTTGASGAVLGRIPGTGAYDLDKTIDTIKANIGFTELQAMRAASPTGGALGQIAVRELDFLQAALGSLDRGQSRPQLERNLAAVKNHFNRWAEAVQQAGQEPQAKAQRVIDFNSLPK